MATNLKNIFQTAAHIVHAILTVFNGPEEAKAANDAILEAGLKIAQMLHDRKVPADILPTAQSFLHSLLQGQHVLNLNDVQINALIDQAISLATQLHKRE